MLRGLSYSLIGIIFFSIFSCKNENEFVTKNTPLFKHKDKRIEAYQNYEIRLSFDDIDQKIQSFCLDNEKGISKIKLLEMIRDDNSYTAPNTDQEGVTQLSFKDINILDIEMKYEKDEFECQGSAKVEIPKIKWKGRIDFPQKINTYKMIKGARESF
jgi:hypothetical protein